VLSVIRSQRNGSPAGSQVYNFHNFCANISGIPWKAIKFYRRSVPAYNPWDTKARCLTGVGEPLEDAAVQFRLLYSGNQLLANGDARQKQIIRRTFHSQLKQLWSSNQNLEQLSINRGNSHLKFTFQEQISLSHRQFRADEAKASFLKHEGDRWQRGAFRFLPLVEERYCLRVSIDILFLRPDRHPLIKAGGDLDNRLKTLFDALRVPDTTDGLGSPLEGEDPFFVLLQDDSLISEIRVDTDNLLMLPNQQVVDAKQAFLVLDVKLVPTSPALSSIF
jgi:hypothetical protein